MLPPIAPDISDKGDEFVQQHADTRPDQDPYQFLTIDPAVEMRRLQRGRPQSMRTKPQCKGLYEVCFSRKDVWLATYFDGERWPYISEGFAISWRGLAEEFKE